MRNYFTHLCDDMDAQIEELQRNKPTTHCTPNIITIVESSLDKLKKFMDDHPFENAAEEIHFFKVLKPKIVSKLIYFRKIYQIEIEKPLGSLKQKEAQLNLELDLITKSYLSNATFIHYFRSGKTDYDQKYFIRKNAHQIPIHECYSCEINYHYGTGYDLIVALALAHEMLEIYLNGELQNLMNPTKLLNTDKNTTCGVTCETLNLNWTGSQTALVEIIYGLYTTGVFNNGTAEIKDIAKYFENSFNIQINQLYRTFSDIKNRKNERLKFIELMKNLLEKNISDDIVF